MHIWTAFHEAERLVWLLLFFFFNDTATTGIYTLSLHDALPISTYRRCGSEKSAAHPESSRRTSDGSSCSTAASSRSRTAIGSRSWRRSHRSRLTRAGSEERRVGKECRSRWSPY